MIVRISIFARTGFYIFADASNTATGGHLDNRLYKHLSLRRRNWRVTLGWKSKQ